MAENLEIDDAELEEVDEVEQTQDEKAQAEALIVAQGKKDDQEALALRVADILEERRTKADADRRTAEQAAKREEQTAKSKESGVPDIAAMEARFKQLYDPNDDAFDLDAAMSLKEEIGLAKAGELTKKQIDALRAELEPFKTHTLTIAGQEGMRLAKQGLDEAEQAELDKLTEEFKWDPASYNDPGNREIAQSTAMARAAKASGKAKSRPIPGVAATAANPVAEVDRGTRRELSKLEAACKSLNIKYDEKLLMSRIEA